MRVAEALVLADSLEHSSDPIEVGTARSAGSALKAATAAALDLSHQLFALRERHQAVLQGLTVAAQQLRIANDSAIESEAEIEDLQRRHAGIVDSAVADAGASSLEDGGDGELDDEVDNGDSPNAGHVSADADLDALRARLSRLVCITRAVSADLVRDRQARARAVAASVASAAASAETAEHLAASERQLLALQAEAAASKARVAVLEVELRHWTGHTCAPAPLKAAAAASDRVAGGGPSLVDASRTLSQRSRRLSRYRNVHADEDEGGDDGGAAKPRHPRAPYPRGAALGDSPTASASGRESSRGGSPAADSSTGGGGANGDPWRRPSTSSRGSSPAPSAEGGSGGRGRQRGRSNARGSPVVPERAVAGSRRQLVRYMSAEPASRADRRAAATAAPAPAAAVAGSRIAEAEDEGEGGVGHSARRRPISRHAQAGTIAAAPRRVRWTPGNEAAAASAVCTVSDGEEGEALPPGARRAGGSAGILKVPAASGTPDKAEKVGRGWLTPFNKWLGRRSKSPAAAAAAASPLPPADAAAVVPAAEPPAALPEVETPPLTPPAADSAPRASGPPPPPPMPPFLRDVPHGVMQLLALPEVRSLLSALATYSSGVGAAQAAHAQRSAAPSGSRRKTAASQLAPASAAAAVIAAASPGVGGGDEDDPGMDASDVVCGVAMSLKSLVVVSDTLSRSPALWAPLNDLAASSRPTSAADSGGFMRSMMALVAPPAPASQPELSRIEHLRSALFAPNAVLVDVPAEAYTVLAAESLTAMVSLLGAMHSAAAMGAASSVAVVAPPSGAGAGSFGANYARENEVISRLAAIDRAFSDSVHLAASFLQRCLLRSLADAQHALTIASRMLARSAVSSNDAVVALMDHCKSPRTLAALSPVLRRVSTARGAIFQTVAAVPAWKPDSQAGSCLLCGQVFSAYFRRHHCRCCGDVVCANCSGHVFDLSAANLPTAEYLTRKGDAAGVMPANAGTSTLLVYQGAPEVESALAATPAQQRSRRRSSAASDGPGSFSEVGPAFGGRTPQVHGHRDSYDGGSSVGTASVDDPSSGVLRLTFPAAATSALPSSSGALPTSTPNGRPPKPAAAHSVRAVASGVPTRSIQNVPAAAGSAESDDERFHAEGGSGSAGERAAADGRGGVGKRVCDACYGTLRLLPTRKAVPLPPPLP